MKDNDAKCSREGTEKNNSHCWHETRGYLTSQAPSWSNNPSRVDGERELCPRNTQAQPARATFVNVKCPWKLAQF